MKNSHRFAFSFFTTRTTTDIQRDNAERHSLGGWWSRIRQCENIFMLDKDPFSECVCSIHIFLVGRRLVANSLRGNQSSKVEAQTRNQ